MPSFAVGSRGSPSACNSDRPWDSQLRLKNKLELSSLFLSPWLGSNSSFGSVSYVKFRKIQLFRLDCNSTENRIHRQKRWKRFDWLLLQSYNTNKNDYKALAANTEQPHARWKSYASKWSSGNSRQSSRSMPWPFFVNIGTMCHKFIEESLSQQTKRSRQILGWFTDRLIALDAGAEHGLRGTPLQILNPLGFLLVVVFSSLWKNLKRRL